jgi:hypothetical protein
LFKKEASASFLFYDNVLTCKKSKKMKNKRNLLSIILFLGVLLLLIIYFSRDNTSESTIESKAISEDTQAEAQHRIDAFSNSNLKPSRNIISAPVETATNDQQPDGEVGSLIAEEETLNRECRDGSGDNPETLKFCDKRDAVFTKLNELGWCFGREDQSEADKQWGKCHAEHKDSQVQNPAINQIDDITDEKNLLACLMPKAEHSQYSSYDGGKSARLLLLEDCRDEYLIYLNLCLAKGNKKQGCVLASAAAAQLALKTFNK